MQKKGFLLLTLIHLLLYFPTFSQNFGGNAPSIGWRQINTDQFRIIFPEDAYPEGNRVASIFQHFSNHFQADTLRQRRKINVVLQNRTIRSNGYVTLGPFRSEFYTTPPPNSLELGSIPWLDFLAIHEYRHVYQDNQFNTGLSHVMAIVFGQLGQSLANHTAIPDWFYEGDAVYQETNTSRQGRGALPSFYNGFRALWNDDKNYSWLKIRNGSLADYIPNEYNLGFLLVAHGYEQYGEDFWNRVTTDAASYKNLFYPFQQALRKHSEISFPEFRKQAFGSFRDYFSSEKQDRQRAPQPDYYLNEQFPVFQGDTLIYMKSSVRELPTFYYKTDRGDHKIRMASRMIDAYFSYNNGKIVYASLKPDVRWDNRAYNELRVLDMQTGKERKIASHTRYFSPDIDAKGERIVAVNSPVNGPSSLHLLDAHDGKLIRSLPNPDSMQYTFPKFSGTGKVVSAVRNPEGKMSLMLQDLQSDSLQYLIPFTFNAIAFPFMKGDTIYFSMSYQNNDEIMAFTIADHRLWRIEGDSLTGFGKYHTAINNNAAAWSSFTAQGFRLQKVPLAQLHFTEITPRELPRNTSSFGIMSLNNKHANQLYMVPDTLFPDKKYYKAGHLFYFHSLVPSVDDPEYSLSWISENILNTMQADISFTYNRVDQSKIPSVAFRYGGWFPVVSAGVDYTFGRNIEVNNQKMKLQAIEPHVGVALPLNFSGGRYFTHLTIQSDFVFNHSWIPESSENKLGTPNYSYISNTLNFSHQLPRAAQHIQPRLAQAVSLSYKAATSGAEGRQALGKISLYFPGPLPTHGVRLSAAHLRKDSLHQINFSSGFPFSRGYQGVNFYRMNFAGINYYFPIAYPDAGVASIVYLLRIRANLFFDYTHIRDYTDSHLSSTRDFRSAGIEMYFDTKWWNQAPVSFGIRYARLLDPDLFGEPGRNRWEFILPLNLLEN